MHGQAYKQERYFQVLKTKREPQNKRQFVILQAKICKMDYNYRAGDLTLSLTQLYIKQDGGKELDQLSV